jgi:hypothetical protein
VPSIESIRREIKRRMREMILDSASISQYAAALARLDGIKATEKEVAMQEDTVATTVIYTPEEDKAPPADEPSATP